MSGAQGVAKRQPRWRVDPAWPHPEDVEAARAAWGELPEEIRTVVSAFWGDWYMRTGHKRLGRIVLGKPTELKTRVVDQGVDLGKED